MVVAKTLQAQTKLVDQLQKRSVSRIYECICIGVITSGATIDAPIGRSSANRQRMAVIDRSKLTPLVQRAAQEISARLH